MNGQQVAVQQPLLGSLVVTEFAFMHLGGRRRRLGLGLSVVMLQSVREQRRLLVELLATHFTLKGRLAAQSMHLHVVMEAGLLVGGEITVCALVLLPRQDVLVMVLGVSLEETS